MTSHADTYYRDFQQRLAAARALYYQEKMASGAVRALSGILAIALSCSALEAVFHLGIAGRTILLLSAAVGSTALAVALVLRPFLAKRNILHSLSEYDIADRVGALFPEIKDRLRNVLELARLVQDQAARVDSPELVDAAAKDLFEASSALPFTTIVSFDPLRVSARWCTAAVLASIVLFGVSATGLSDAGRRIFHCSQDFRPPAPFDIHISPGNASVVKGLPVSFTIELNASKQVSVSRLPKSVLLLLQPDGVTVAEQIPLTPDSLGKFTYTIPAAKQSLRFRASAGEMRSDEFRLTVVDRPYVRSFTVSVTQPQYARLPRQMMEDNTGDISGLAGSLIQWTAEANKKIASASVLFSDGTVIQCALSDSRFSARSLLRLPLTYHFSLTDEAGNSSINPIEYRMDVIPDETPIVAIPQPGRNVDITEAMMLPLHLKFHDDYGISSLRLAYRLIQSKYEKPQEHYSYVPISFIPNDRHETGMTGVDGEVDYSWILSSLGLVPEDVVEYRAEIFDNDIVSGPKMGVSETYLLRLPSIDEVFADVDKAQSSASRNLDESLKQAEEFKKDVDNLAREMKKSQPPDWQQQKKAAELAKKYEDLQKKVDQANRTIDEMAQQLQKNNVLSPETLEKYMELQQMMQQMDLKEFQEAMKRLQNSMQNFSPDQIKDAMQKIQFTEEAFRKSIERTLNLLKRIQVEQKVDEMVKRSEQLQEQQESLQKETAKSDPNDRQKTNELSRKQQDLRNDLKDLQKQLSELRKKMEEFAKEMPMDDLQKSEEAANDREMEQSMAQSEQQLQEHQPQQSQQSQQKAGKKMQKMTQQLSRMQQQLLSRQMQETMAALRRAMKDLLQISQKEEALKNQTQRTDPTSPSLRDQAETQQDVAGDLRNVTNGLAELSQKSFMVTPEMGKAIGEAMGRMNQATAGLDQRNGAAAGEAQTGAMASLNQAAQMVQDAMQSMQEGGSGGGGSGSLMQQLRRMTGQQQGINMQTQQMGQGQGMSQEQMQQAGRLAAQQDALRKSLEQLNKEAQTSSERNRILGDLQRIADEMREVVKDMEQGNVNPNTLRQQEKILSRMLEAQSSLRERDFEQRRRSAVGKMAVRPGPSALPAGVEMDKLRRDLIKALEEGYSKDYQELIRKYFEALGKK